MTTLLSPRSLLARGPMSPRGTSTAPQHILYQVKLQIDALQGIKLESKPNTEYCITWKRGKKRGDTTFKLPKNGNVVFDQPFGFFSKVKKQSHLSTKLLRITLKMRNHKKITKVDRFTLDLTTFMSPTKPMEVPFSAWMTCGQLEVLISTKPLLNYVPTEQEQTETKSYLNTKEKPVRKRPVLIGKFLEGTSNAITRAVSASAITPHMATKKQKPIHRRTTTSPSLLGGNFRNNPGPQILMLGTLGSGKTTFSKHLVRKHDPKSFHEAEYLPFIYKNIVENMQILCAHIMETRENLPKDWREEMVYILSFDMQVSQAVTLFPTFYRAIRLLCMDDQFFEIIKASRWNVPAMDENIYHFLLDIERFDPGMYKPTIQDIMFCRKKTSGVIENNVTISKNSYSVTDVGGARAERKKWGKLLARDIGHVFYFASVLDYDKKLYEDDKTSRFVESVQLFDNVINDERNADRSVTLILTGVDLLPTKLQHSKFSKYCKDFNGDSVRAVKRYILNKYLERNTTNKKVSVFFVNCLDEESVIQVLQSVGQFVDTSGDELNENMLDDTEFCDVDIL